MCLGVFVCVWVCVYLGVHMLGGVCTCVCLCKLETSSSGRHPALDLGGDFKMEIKTNK